MGNDSSSLNDDFSAQTSAGDNIFSKPLGARTFFCTANGGLVCASFLFDPKQEYGEDHNMASVTNDWMGDLRDALTQQLLDPKDIAPKVKSLEETMWDQMTSLIPKETIAKNFFADKETFKKYSDLLRASITRNFKEEQELTNALATRAFSFSFEIAIDAYPQELGGKNEKRAGTCGVLTFHLEGIPDGKMPMPAEEEEESPTRKTKKRKHQDDDAATKAKKSAKKSGAEKLLKELALTELFEAATVEKKKKLPLSATAFFEAINRWFSSTVSRKASKLEKARDRNPLYQ